MWIDLKTDFIFTKDIDIILTHISLKTSHIKKFNKYQINDLITIKGKKDCSSLLILNYLKTVLPLEIFKIIF